MNVAVYGPRRVDRVRPRRPLAPGEDPAGRGDLGGARRRRRGRRGAARQAQRRRAPSTPCSATTSSAAARKERLTEARGDRARERTSRGDLGARFVYVDAVGERTITCSARSSARRGRGPRTSSTTTPLFSSLGRPTPAGGAPGPGLVAVTRELPILRQGAVELDALVGSGEDDAERYHPGDLDPPPKLVVTTSGSLGGWTQPAAPTAPHRCPAGIGRLRLRRLRSPPRSRSRSRAGTRPPRPSRSPPAAAPR